MGWYRPHKAPTSQYRNEIYKLSDTAATTRATTPNTTDAPIRTLSQTSLEYGSVFSNGLFFGFLTAFIIVVVLYLQVAATSKNFSTPLVVFYHIRVFTDIKTEGVF